MARGKVQKFPSRDPHRDFEQVIAEELKNQPLTLVLLEVDDLHHFNKTYGHQRGDKVIEGVTCILERNIRKNDVVTRVEAGFALILRDADPAVAARVCERIRTSVEEAIFAPLHGQVLRTTLSAGYATSTVDAPFKQAKGFVQAAQDFLNQAKQSGQNRVIGCQPKVTATELTTAWRKGSSQ